ncbi:MAG TPA: MBL fold metallo-hydrolase [Stenomitos sp.]
MSTIPLEDNFNDVLAKALHGLKVSPEAAASRAGVDAPGLKRLLDGEFDEPTARKVAPVLQLGEEQLVMLGQQAYSPDVTPPDGLLGFNTPYADFFVNAYLVWDPGSKQAVVFDTGTDGEAIVRAASERGLTISLILVTHTHQDHIMCLESLRQQTGAPAFVSPDEPTPCAEGLPTGRFFQLGGLSIKALPTSGHSKGGTSYYVTGLSRPLVVVGDALFAASMGRGNVSYQDALENNRREIFSLPDETIICPGHGPLTTVALEKQHNPFYPEFAH